MCAMLCGETEARISQLVDGGLRFWALDLLLACGLFYFFLCF